MSTTLTPPPTPPAAAPQPTPPAPSGGAGKVIAILAIVFGGVLIAGALTFGVVRSVAASATTRTEGYTADVTGVSGLDVEASAGSVRIEFTDTPDATLRVTGGWGAGDWTLTRDEDELVVRSPDRWFGWWFGDVERAVLELPSSLQGSDFDASLNLSAGDIEADGEFGELELDVSAGDATVSGTATSLDVEVSAGTATVELDDVRTAELTVSAGDLNVALGGRAPDDVQVDVSAGDLDLRLPDGTYQVISDVSAGDLDNQLDTASSAANVVTVNVSAGSATLRPGR